uniref:Uncharacterized protein n=1 Tax=Cacopsylla melanoneura TaxID=428564 RepID=A0A8D8YUX2_9HEMI
MAISTAVPAESIKASNSFLHASFPRSFSLGEEMEAGQDSTLELSSEFLTCSSSLNCWTMLCRSLAANKCILSESIDSNVDLTLSKILLKGIPSARSFARVIFSSFVNLKY